MSWNKLLQPDLVLGSCILNLRPETLKDYRIKGLVLDVDETLVPLRSPHASEELQVWIQDVKQVATLWLVSNNVNLVRIRRIAEPLDIPYIAGAGKPSRRKMRQAIAAMDLPVEQIAMVGDRLFTDVLVGNRLGMFTILVEPMLEPEIPVSPSRMRSFEVWLSQILGASLTLTAQQNFTNREDS